MFNFDEIRNKLDKAEEYLRSPDYYIALMYLQNTKNELQELINNVSKHYDPVTGEEK